MCKRARTTTDRTLTGGTGDVNPQWYYIGTVNRDITGATAPNGQAVASYVDNPVLPLNQTSVPNSQRAYALEILKVEFSWVMPSVSFDVPGRDASMLMSLFEGRKDVSVQPISDVNMLGTYGPEARGYIAGTSRKVAIATIGTPTAATESLAYNRTETYDCTDSQGHGILVASSTVTVVFGFFSTLGTGGNTFGKVTVRVLGRVHQITLGELLTAQNALLT